MKLYRVIDHDRLGVLSWTATTPATKHEIARALTDYHNRHKHNLSTLRWAMLPAWGEPKLSDLLNVYNLELMEV